MNERSVRPLRGRQQIGSSTNDGIAAPPPRETGTVGYILTFDPSRGSGLWRRLLERLDVWAGMGVTADVFICCRRDSDLVGYRDPAVPHRFHVLAGRSSFQAAFRLPKAVSAVAPDVLYFRYNSPYPPMIGLARRWPTVMEVHADDTREWSRRPLKYQAMGRTFRTALLGRAVGFVFVDPDLVDSSSFPRPRLGSRLISNGVRIDPSIDYGGPRRRPPGPPRMILVAGTAERYQGVEKLLRLAAMMPDVEFHVVGPSPAVGEVGRNVVFHGRQPPDKMPELLARADIGLANLELEDIGMRRPSPLKVREYVAAGLPCVLAHDDPDLAGQDGVLTLPFGFVPDQQIAARVREFAERWRGSHCPRAMAEAVDIRPKEAARIEFLMTAAGRHPANGGVVTPGDPAR